MRRYPELRALIQSAGETCGDLVAHLNLSKASLSARMNAKIPFSTEECYAILSHYEEDERQIYKFFPPRGVPKKWR